MQFDVHHFLHFDAPGIERALLRIIRTGATIMADLSVLQATVDALGVKATETNATLAALAQAVVDLKNAPDQQAAIDAITAQAQGVLDGLSAAEDAADDALGTAEPAPQA
jgi:hypothetical protein